VNGKKVCGILTEMSTEMDCINHIVIGIGINVNTESFPEEISAVATSLSMETNATINRSQLIATILKQFEPYYHSYLSTCDLSFLIAEYNSLLINVQKEVMILEGTDKYKGIALGINETGELLVQVGDLVKTIVAGEVSVRGIYGYV
jgi:BirA family biotin operon repressor/biotin-[acetyl-CoA-carboxylase] ligase